MTKGFNFLFILPFFAFLLFVFGSLFCLSDDDNHSLLFLVFLNINVDKGNKNEILNVDDVNNTGITIVQKRVSDNNWTIWMKKAAKKNVWRGQSDLGEVYSLFFSVAKYNKYMRALLAFKLIMQQKKIKCNYDTYSRKGQSWKEMIKLK